MKLESFDLNLLVALNALLEESHVGRAAERLRVGQPAMSATLARLRSTFDDPLFVKEGRGVRPTPFAESLKAPVRAVLAQVESIVSAGSTFDPSADERSFTIVASDYVALILLRPLIERLGNLAPNVQIHVRPVEPGSLGALSRGLADLVIMPRELLPQRLTDPWEALFEDRFVCVVAADADVGESITPDEFSRLPYLVSSSSVSELSSIVESRLDDAAIVRKVEMVSNSFVMAPFLLPGTRLITVIQEKLATALMGDKRSFRTLPTPVPLDSISELMLWPPRLTPDLGHEWLRKQLREIAALL